MRTVNRIADTVLNRQTNLFRLIQGKFNYCFNSMHNLSYRYIYFLSTVRLFVHFLLSAEDK